MQDFLVIFFVFTIFSWNLSNGNAQTTFNLMKYGAKGDGKTDDTQVSGKIVAPNSIGAWGTCGDTWLSFSGIAGLTLDGTGSIDGQGSVLWGQQQCRPTALHFHDCNNMWMKGLSFINSPRAHIVINSCAGVSISNIKITAPDESPNTDGIDISRSTNVRILDSVIGTGDDCVAINGGSSNITVTNIACGPGHGISIGSLGDSGTDDSVEEVNVQYCNFTSTMNGARIKTVPGGTGYARKITYDHITFDGTSNPIIIDQHYCNGKVCAEKGKAVAVSDITFSNMKGTYSKEEAITLICDSSTGCNNVRMEQINLTPSTAGEKGNVTCSNVKGERISVTPPVPCLSAGCAAMQSCSVLTHSVLASLFEACDFLVIFFIFTIFSWNLCAGNAQTTFNVMKYGAKGDGKTDDTQVSGKIVAPNSIGAWGTCGDMWLSFNGIAGLTLDGTGSIDGRGSVLWGQKQCRPTAVHVNNCNNMRIKGLSFINSPRAHIVILGSAGVSVSGIKITAPDESPNTDGIDISRSTNVQILDSVIGTGDDCVAINGGSSNITVTNIACGPGHGISIGSLGDSGSDDSVEEVNVQYCNFTSTMNGARIKTVPGGTGYARKITYDHITFVATSNPIIIDQHYCNGQGKAVAVSDITFSNMRGTYSNDEAITLICDSSTGCNNVRMEQINLTPSKAGKKGTAVKCSNVKGERISVTPPVPCLSATKE
ncbi:hypothetical protein Tsubulata_018124 [Turnera subulata]|uniref:Polygalacturonase n=1 Tax=Turnera subulata TaxID=218843 RepID=A0A9Q0JFK9_9ROSI|nr:hypothetical protein Tsubulata_018124 [Turnera subulata]